MWIFLAAFNLNQNKKSCLKTLRMFLFWLLLTSTFWLSGNLFLLVNQSETIWDAGRVGDWWQWVLFPVYYRHTYKIQDARGHMPTHNKNSFLGSHSTANHKQMKTCTHSYTLAPHTRTNTLTQIPMGSNKYIPLKNDTKTHTHTPKQTLNFQQHHIYALSQTHTVKLLHKHPHIT